jgi:hypothetical protein
LFTGVLVTGNEFIAGGVVTGDNCSQVTTPPAINLCLVSTTLAITENLLQELIRRNKDKIFTVIIDTAEQLIASVADTSDKHLFANISANFQKKSKRPQ